MIKLSDVAKRAGVSSMTVSRVINHPDKVSADTILRVRKAMEELQYVSNGPAKSLALGQTRILALLVPDVTNPFFTTVARGAEDVARNAGYRLILCNTDENPEVEWNYLQMSRSRQVDGLIVSVCDDNSAEHLKVLPIDKVPVVLVDRKIPGEPYLDYVVGDNVSASEQLIDYLIARGHTRFGFVFGNPAVSVIRDRMTGVQRSLQSHDLIWRADLCLTHACSRADYRSITEDWIPRHHVTAIFAWNNLTAAHVYHLLVSHGYRVPDDVLVSCFDNPDPLSITNGFIPFVQQPAYEMGRKATIQLLERIAGSGGQGVIHQILVSQLVDRTLAPTTEIAEHR